MRSAYGFLNRSSRRDNLAPQFMTAAMFLTRKRERPENFSSKFIPLLDPNIPSESGGEFGGIDMGVFPVLEYFCRHGIWCFGVGSYADLIALDTRAAAWRSARVCTSSHVSLGFGFLEPFFALLSSDGEQRRAAMSSS